MTIYTIGHSNTPMEKLIGNLRLHGIETLVDVRSSPYSKHAPQYSHDFLKAEFDGGDIGYEFMGDCLGGMPAKPEYRNSKGEPDYGKMAKDDWFEDGIERVISMASRSVVCLMCSEEDPAKCHRSMLVSAELAKRKVRVLHIRGDGALETEEENAKRRFSAKKAQMDLF